MFGWDTHTAGDTEDFRYTTLGEGENPLAGIMDSTGHELDGTPAYWIPYFRVDDVDATLQAIAAAGGTVVRDAEDTPYGRLAAAKDSTGARSTSIG